MPICPLLAKCQLSYIQQRPKYNNTCTLYDVCRVLSSIKHSFPPSKYFSLGKQERRRPTLHSSLERKAMTDKEVCTPCQMKNECVSYSWEVALGPNGSRHTHWNSSSHLQQQHPSWSTSYFWRYIKKKFWIQHIKLLEVNKTGTIKNSREADGKAIQCSNVTSSSQHFRNTFLWGNLSISVERYQFVQVKVWSLSKNIRKNDIVHIQTPRNLQPFTE